ncbi:EthD family reductase [Parasedimentitalea huanghaiensis]|uniref:EthD family reductase n=1 Tax=Parasedimentitalea huanghaiensis TaxID=2682100 RepID=A0A6L6WCV7_9RHOB|nr:EthD family reductase [Zongyanglinia huanghaiensis]MVO15088.1 EthD family reductase [Zongyanglinia huanghaiensis]
MAVSLQVIYPISEGTTFDYSYYTTKHFDLVGEHMGEHIETMFVTKGLAGGPDTPPGIYAVATLVFENQDALNASMAAAPPVLADIANFTNVQPQMLIGEVIS